MNIILAADVPLSQQGLSVQAPGKDGRLQYALDQCPWSYDTTISSGFQPHNRVFGSRVV